MKKRILLFALTICLFTGCQKEQTLTTQLTTMPEEIAQATTDVSVKVEDNHEPTEPVTSLETTMPITSAPVEETTTVETTPPTEDVPTETIDQVTPESEPVTTEPPTETECLPEVWEDPTEPPDETAPCYRYHRQYLLRRTVLCLCGAGNRPGYEYGGLERSVLSGKKLQRHGGEAERTGWSGISVQARTKGMRRDRGRYHRYDIAAVLPQDGPDQRRT